VVCRESVIVSPCPWLVVASPGRLLQAVGRGALCLLMSVKRSITFEDSWMNDELSIPVMVRLSPDQAECLDEWRRKQKDLPGRPEAIRRLLDEKLNFPKPTRVAARKSTRRIV
jgi:hypothetical protein